MCQTLARRRLKKGSLSVAKCATCRSLPYRAFVLQQIGPAFVQLLVMPRHLASRQLPLPESPFDRAGPSNKEPLEDPCRINTSKGRCGRNRYCDVLLYYLLLAP